MVKGAIVILLLGFGLVIGTYYLGGVASHDPTKMGEEAKAKIEMGMTWQEVLDAAGTPNRVRILFRTTEKVMGEDVEVVKVGTPIKFDRTTFESDFDNGSMKEGFIFEFVFSHQVAFAVFFDGKGIAQSMDDIATMADLLKTRKHD